jgi:amino-acid N-acetyltransferase
MMAAGSTKLDFTAAALAPAGASGETFAMQYQPASSTDLDGIQALLAACALPTEDLTPALLSGFLVAGEAGAVVGCVGLERLGDCALLRSLAVEPAHRGRGIAERLCDEAEELALAAGVGTLYLLTTTAAEYFEGRGFDRVSRESLPASVRATAQFRDLCPATAVAMRKRLAGTGEPSSRRRRGATSC